MKNAPWGYNGTHHHCIPLVSITFFINNCFLAILNGLCRVACLGHWLIININCFPFHCVFQPVYKSISFKLNFHIFLFCIKTTKNVNFFSSLGCTNCIDGEFTADKNRWTMPLQKLGEKQYYLGIFFKVKITN